MADPYAFDLKIDVAKTRQWSERVNRQRQSGPDESDNDSDGLDDFLDDDDDDNDGDDHFDVSDSASFSDSESGKFRRQPQPTTADSPVFPGSRDSLNSSVGFGAAVELRMDPEQKAALSGSVQGMIQTRHDLDTIRWSQDSAVRAAMEEAEKFEQDTPAASGAAAVPFANTRSSKPSLGVRASMRSAGALKEGDDEDIDDDDASDVSSYNGSLSVSAPPSFRSSAKPIAQPQQPQASARVPAPAPQGAASTAASTTAKATTATARTVVPSVPAKPLNSTGLASPYSDVYTSDPDVGENDDDEYGDDSRGSLRPTQQRPGLSLQLRQSLQEATAMMTTTMVMTTTTLTKKVTRTMSPHGPPLRTRPVAVRTHPPTTFPQPRAVQVALVLVLVAVRAALVVLVRPK